MPTYDMFKAAAQRVQLRKHILHDLLVWFFCHGVADVDEELGRFLGDAAIRARFKSAPRSSHDIAADVFRRTRGRRSPLEPTGDDSE